MQTHLLGYSPVLICTFLIRSPPSSEFQKHLEWYDELSWAHMPKLPNSFHGAKKKKKIKPRSDELQINETEQQTPWEVKLWSLGSPREPTSSGTLYSTCSSTLLGAGPCIENKVNFLYNHRKNKLVVNIINALCWLGTQFLFEQPRRPIFIYSFLSGKLHEKDSRMFFFCLGMRANFCHLPLFCTTSWVDIIHSVMETNDAGRRRQWKRRLSSQQVTSCHL